MRLYLTPISEGLKAFLRSKGLGSMSYEDGLSFFSPNQPVERIDLAFSEAAESFPERFGALLTNIAGPLAERLLQAALSHYPNKVAYPDEVILRDTLYGSFTLYHPFLAHFDKAKAEWVKSGLAYLDHHADKKEAAEALYLHRNSLLYRLRKLKEVAGIDINEPHEVALLLIFRALKVGLD